MKYIPLESLQNKYPSISNYTKRNNGVTIKGIYNENSLDILTPNFDTLGVVDQTSFKFIVQVFDNKVNQNLLTTFTSQKIYDNLQIAKESSNPYYINSVLNSDTYSKIYLDDIKKIFDKQVELEKKFNVTVNYNVIFDENGVIDYEKFGQYIDWVVSTPALEDIDTNGVLPSEEISSFTRGEFGNLAEDREDPEVIVDPPDVFFGDLNENNSNNSSGIYFGEGDFMTNPQAGNRILLGGRPESNSPAGRIRNLFRRRTSRD